MMPKLQCHYCSSKVLEVELNCVKQNSAADCVGWSNNRNSLHFRWAGATRGSLSHFCSSFFQRLKPWWGLASIHLTLFRIKLQSSKKKTSNRMSNTLFLYYMLSSEALKTGDELKKMNRESLPDHKSAREHIQTFQLPIIHVWVFNLSYTKRCSLLPKSPRRQSTSPPTAGFWSFTCPRVRSWLTEWQNTE